MTRFSFGSLLKNALTGRRLDLHPSAFPAGTCTRTLYGKAEIILWRTAPDRFRIETGRSFIAYVHGPSENVH